jgi:hypothetical protein
LRLGLVGGAAVLFAGVVVLLAILWPFGDSASREAAPGRISRSCLPVEASPREDFSRYSRDHGPFTRGRQVSLPEAEEIVSLPLLRPDHCLASDELIRSVFVEVVGGNEQVAIDYESGIFVFLDRATGTLGEDPMRWVEAELAESPPQAQLTEIQGVPALAAPANIDDAGNNPSVVIFALQGVRITVMGRYAAFDWQVLAEVAQSIR